MPDPRGSRLRPRSAAREPRDSVASGSRVDDHRPRAPAQGTEDGDAREHHPPVASSTIRIRDALTVGRPNDRPGTRLPRSPATHEGPHRKRPNPRHAGSKLERLKGLEPSTSTLARLRSTTELQPHPCCGSQRIASSRTKASPRARYRSPAAAIRVQWSVYMDGLGWRPLRGELDYDATARRVRAQLEAPPEGDAAP